MIYTVDALIEKKIQRVRFIDIQKKSKNVKFCIVYVRNVWKDRVIRNGSRGPSSLEARPFKIERSV